MSLSELYHVGIVVPDIDVARRTTFVSAGHRMGTRRSRRTPKCALRRAPTR